MCFIHLQGKVLSNEYKMNGEMVFVGRLVFHYDFRL